MMIVDVVIIMNDIIMIRRMGVVDETAVVN
jgi:hypothetical protein